LSALFLLFGIGCFWLSLQKNATTLSVYDLRLRFSKPVLLLITSLALICAVLAKELALAGLGLYGLVLLLHMYQHRVKVRQMVRRYSLPLITISLLLILGISYAYIRQTSLNFDPNFDYSVIDPLYPTSILVRLLTFTRALPLYISTYGFPFLLHMDHTLPVLSNPLNPWTVLVLVSTFLAIGFASYELKKQKTVWFAFGATWFLLGLVPVSGIIPVNGLFYEHWLYLPSIGLSVCGLAILRVIGAAIFSNKQLAFLQKSYAEFRVYVPGLILVVLFFLTIRQNYLWGDQERFFAYTLRFSQSARLYNNLAMAQAEKGKMTQAVENYQKALEISPNYPQIYHNIGNILANQGQLENALQYYLKAIEVDPTFTFSYPKAMMLANGLHDASASDKILESANEYLSPESTQMLKTSSTR
ncbi:tetratricopeptide repeat protein, partial [Candidatus Woesebacteria bacterium]|nr:tetratricopeptide repeat protein [Candidatus Woesebacteria bacterium]